MARDLMVSTCSAYTPHGQPYYLTTHTSRDRQREIETRQWGAATGGQRTMSLNRAVEKLFTLKSLLAGFEIADCLVQWLEERSAAGHVGGSSISDAAEGLTPPLWASVGARENLSPG